MTTGPAVPDASPQLAGEARTAVPPCRACAAELDADQRYCLNCGEPVGGLAPALEAPIQTSPPVALAAAPPSYRSSTVYPLAALGGATLAGALLTALLIAALGGNAPAPIAVNVPAAKAPVVNVAAAPTGAPVAEPAFASDWPGGNRWTVQLQVLPKSGATSASVAAAKAVATSAGAADVGALDSDAHSSLPAGNYVVYSGVFKTRAQATAAQRKLASKIAGAKAVRVASAATAQASRATTKKLDDLRDSSGDDYTEKSKKLPDSVVTPGPAAPKEDPPAAPADEGDTDVIG